MAILAYGAEKLRALETALGGEPPRKAAEQSLAELERHFRERFERRSAYRAIMRPLIEQIQAPLIQLVKEDPAAAQAAEKRRNIILARRKEKLSRVHPDMKAVPRMVTGSGLVLKEPPYNEPFQFSAGAATASADINAGVYSLSATGNGSSAAAGAGVGIWFFATADDPAQRVAAFMKYVYSWLDTSAWYTAHNDGSTNIWVWGHNENTWVVQKGGLFPSWSDGTADNEDHGSGGDGSEQSGSESLEAFFPAAANSWYLAWVWSDGSCDDSLGGVFGFSFAQQSQIMSVPFVVFGSL
jgi:hypothetical protein